MIVLVSRLRIVSYNEHVLLLYEYTADCGFQSERKSIVKQFMTLLSAPMHSLWPGVIEWQK